jgi:isochorismate synthase
VNETHVPSVTLRVSPEELESRDGDLWHDRVVSLLRGHNSVALVLPAPDLTPELLLNPAPSNVVGDWQPCVFWNNTHHTFGDETLVGLGIFAEATFPWGDSSTLEAFGKHHLQSMVGVGPGKGYVSPRVFSAVGFAPKEAVSPVVPWQELSRGWSVVPRLTYVRRASKGVESSWWCLVLRPSDVTQVGQFLRQLTALTQWLEAQPRPTLASLSEPHVSRAASREDWTRLIEDALDELRQERLTKVVAARFVEVAFERAPLPADVLSSLTVHREPSTRFAFLRGDSVFLGATPERLVTKRHSSVETAAVAGTVWPCPDDSTAGIGHFSDKERTEHGPVLEAILSVLAPLCSEVHHDPTPHVCAQRHVLHLRSIVTGTLLQPLHVATLVGHLHPTPAVAGTPTQTALEWIAEHEPFERGLYAGPVGWFDAQGDGQFDVALRSGLLHDRSLCLFGGAGIVPGSLAEREFDETSQKMQVLLGSISRSRNVQV